MQHLLDEIGIPTLWHKPIQLAVWFTLVWVLGRLLRGLVVKSVADNDVSYKSKKAITFGTYVFFVIGIAVIYSSSLNRFTVALGVAGAGIAFALQELIASFAGWLALLFGNFYKPGDRVQLGGIKGDVIDIGILRTTLMETGQWVDGDLYNGRIVRIANSFVFKEPVFNYSSDFPFLWDEIKIPIRYGSDFEMARSILSKVVIEETKNYQDEAKTTWAALTKKYRVENASTDPIVTLVVTDNWIEFTVRYVVNYKKRRITKDHLYTSILKELSQTKGSVQLASATFELTSFPPISLRKNDE